MMKSVAMWALLPFVPFAAASQQPSIPETARKVLEGCGEEAKELAGQADSAWTAPSSALSSHVALRRELNETMPSAATTVMIYAYGGHLEDAEYSVVLYRELDGRWKGDSLGRSRIWVEGAPSTPVPRQRWDISASNGQRLDQILNDKCLYAEPSKFMLGRNGPPPLGGLRMHLDVATPEQQHRSVFLSGEVRGLTAEVVQIASVR